MNITTTHPYIKYALALLMEENVSINNLSDVTESDVKKELQKGLDSFRMKPASDFICKDSVKFIYSSEQNKASNNIYLSPNIISDDIHANNLYKKLKEFCSKSLSLSKQDGLTQSLAPTSGEFSTFGKQIGRGKPKATILEHCLALITSTTRSKPCLWYLNRKNKYVNIGLLPDLEIPQLINFIRLFKRMSTQCLAPDIMVGNVRDKKPKRPKIYRGNFPNAPWNSLYCGVALLGAIGEMTKDADVSDLAHKVLESFKGHNFYIFEYGNAKSFSFNHHIVDLSAECGLSKIVNSMWMVELYKGTLNEAKSDYEKFNFFANRFLTLFNSPTFKDFLAFRASYPTELEPLLIKYFEKMEDIERNIVQSAKGLGAWLNRAAYIAACNSVKSEDNDSQDNPKEKLRKEKYKFLTELESSIFSAKTGDALIAHTIARAGRLSFTDSPESASLFLEKTASGELNLDKAKNLLIAFSRLNTYSQSGEKTEMPIEGTTDETNDYSNI